MNTTVTQTTEDNWLKQLRNDLMRTNKLIKKTRIDVDEGIKQLKVLEQERRRLVNETLKIDEFDEVDVI